MPVSATVLSINTSDPMAAVWSAASAKLLRRTATSELRLLASLVPPHGRLARTHGNEAVVPQVPLRVVNGGGKVEGGKGKDDGPAALVLVGELVEGGSLRGRVKAAAAAAAALSVGSDDEEDAGGEGAAEAAPAQPLLRRRKVLADIAEGLAYLHERGVAHGGLTTENVLLDVGGRAKVRRRRRRRVSRRGVGWWLFVLLGYVCSVPTPLGVGLVWFEASVAAVGRWWLLLGEACLTRSALRFLSFTAGSKPQVNSEETLVYSALWIGGAYTCVLIPRPNEPGATRKILQGSTRNAPRGTTILGLPVAVDVKT